MATLKLLIDAKGAKQGAVDFSQATFNIGQSAKQATSHINGIGAAGHNMAHTLQSVFVAAGVSIGVHKIVHDLLEFETGLVRVGKATGVHGAELDGMGEDFIKLSTRVPIATEQLLELGFAAGQLGVHGKENILAFTETVAMLGTTGNLAGEKAAQALARILNVTRESFSQVKNLGSTIVQVAHGDATTKGTAATESQIANTAVKVAQAAAPFGVKSADVVALSASYASVGVEAQVAATTTGKLLRAFDEAARKGDTFGSKLGEIARVSGMSAKEFQELEKKDPSQAFARFVQGLGNVSKSGGSATQVMQDLGLADERLLKAILPLAKGSEDLVNRLVLARKEFSDPHRLDLEAQKQFVTLASQLKMLGNTFEAFFLMQRGKTDGLRLFVQNLNEALQIILGFRKAIDDTNPTVKILVSLVKDLTAVLALWAAIKVVKGLNDMRVQVLGLGDAMGKATVLSSPLLTAVLAIGVGLASWSIGKTIFDQFESVQRYAEETRHIIAKLLGVLDQAGTRADLNRFKGSTGISNITDEGAAELMARQQLADEARKRGVRATTRPSDDAELKARVKTILDNLRGESSEDIVHQTILDDIKKQFANGGPKEGVGADFAKNFLGAIDDIKKGVGNLFDTSAVSKAARDARDALEHPPKPDEPPAAPYDEMHESLRKVIEQLEFEGKYLKLNNMDRQVTMQIDKMRMDIGDEINDKDEEALGILRKRIALNAQLNAEREIDQEIDRMHQEMELMTMGNEQRAIEVEYRRLINKYIEEGIDLTEKTKKKAHDAAVEMVHMKDATERLQNFAQSVGDAFGKAFEDAALHGKDFKSVMLGLIQDVEQALVHELITTQIVKAVSGAVSGSGFFQGMFGATPHADGTVLTSPTFFNGGRDVAGESGDEGVLPLTRTAGGKLGVHAVGANSKGDGNTTNVYMTVVTQDATSFNKSKRQIMGDLKSGMK